MSVEDLEKLAKLKESGALTQEEFDIKKSQILNEEKSESPDLKDVEIWNPSAAANWSILFSPIFGAFLQAKNWKSLGEQKKSERSMLWVYFVCLIAFLTIILPDFNNYADGIWLLTLLAWYFSSAKAQVKYVKEEFENNYQKKSWAKPVLIAILLLFSFGLVSAIGQSIGPKAYVEPEESFLSSEVLVRPGISDIGINAAQLAELMEKVPLNSGGFQKVKGWTKTDSGYRLHIAGQQNYNIDLVQTGSSFLMQPVKVGGEEFSAMQYMMIMFSTVKK